MKRRPFNFRVADSGHQWLADQAKAKGVTVSDVLRACMTVAARHPSDLASTIDSIKEAL